MTRLPRFKRAPTVVPIELTERDYDIIRLFHRHRFLRSPQITALLGGSSQQLLRRLQSLYHHGYLERPRIQLEYYHQGGSRPIVYGLGTKGEALLAVELGITVHPVSWGEKNPPVGRVYLEHALLVSDVMVALELACRKNGRVRLIAGEDLLFPGKDNPPGTIFKWNVKIKDGVKLGVIPDRVFALEFPDGSGNPQRSYFFLEADRGTMPVVRQNLSQTSFQRKLLAYEATWTQNLHRSLFGFHRFRVLTVTTIPGRVKSLADACSQLERGHGLFLFADRTVLEQDPFAAVWQSGKTGEKEPLLNLPKLASHQV